MYLPSEHGNNLSVDLKRLHAIEPIRQ
jgi:hypothetical protein